jgi:hypothetical protein
MKVIRKIYTSSRRQAERELRRRRRQEMRQAVTAARAAALESGLTTPEPESEPDPTPIRALGEHRPRELKYKFTLTGGIFVGPHTWEHLLWCYQ